MTLANGTQPKIPPRLPAQVVQSAMVGTDNLPLPCVAFGDGAQALLAHVPQDEQRVLLGLSISVTQRTAGYQPPTLANVLLPERAPDEGRTPVSRQALSDLSAMLNGHNTDFLREWMMAVAQSGRSVPPEYHVQMIRLGARRNDLQPMLYAVMGERGVWLASQMGRSDGLWLRKSLADVSDASATMRMESILQGSLERDKNPFEPMHIFVVNVTKHRVPWSAALGEALVKRLRQMFMSKKPVRPTQDMAKTLLHCSKYFPPHLCQPLLTALRLTERPYRGWSSVLAEIEVTLQQRAAMLAAIEAS